MSTALAPRRNRFGWLPLLATACLAWFFLTSVGRVQAQETAPHDHSAAAHGQAPAPVVVETDHTAHVPAAPAAGASWVFRAALSGAKENTPVVTRATGYAILALNETGTELSYRVLLDGDIGTVTAAHIHRFSDSGIELPLTVGSGGSISGTIPGITLEQMTGLVDGAYYVNVHTEAHGSGEIAGPILPFDGPTGYSALLNGENERPNPVATDAIGMASFTRVSTATLEYQITISNSTAITLGHIHRGAVNLAGGVVHLLYSNPTPLAEMTPLTGSVELDAQGMVDLLTGYLYVNFHSAAYPAGEIRGQIGGAHLFGANLDGSQEVPAIDTLAYGKAVVALSADASTLVYRVTAHGFDEPIIVGHFHRGQAGQSGPPEIFLPAFGDSTVVTGTTVITPSQVFRLISGGYYINLHTDSHQAGEIRGQVTPIEAEARYSALLTGDTGAGGFVRFKVRPVINVVDFYLAVADIDNLTAAHIHKAPLGESNPAPTHFLYAASDGLFDTTHPASGALIFEALDWVDLLTGFYYVNVHTTEFPAGEIRGQIGRAQLFTANIDGGQEVPPTVTDAFAQGIFALNADASQLAYRIFSNGLDDISLAHIHTGKPGVNGPPDFTLFDGTGLFDDTHPISGTINFTDSHVLKLVTGSYYVNLHLASLNDAGVVRGQIEPFAPPTSLNALLNGANERPNPVETAGAGVAHLGFDQLANTLHVRVAVTNTDTITMAHIHRGPREGFGGVVYGLYAADGPFDSANALVRDVRFNHRDLVDLFSGWFYINVHTLSHLGGEIRGQIGTQRPYQALLNGANERPNPVTTDATGVGTLVLSGAASTLHYRVTVTDITNIVMAHIHVGGPEDAGPVRHTLWNNGPGLFDPTHPISGVVTLSVNDLLHLAGGTFYINVHTTQNMPGEIRGQVEPHHPFGSFQTLLTEGEEVAPAAVDATGRAAFRLNEYPVTTLQYQVSVSDIPTTTMAHIHKGLSGENGPPIFTLTDEEGRLTPTRPLSGAVRLDAAQLLDLLTGYYYVNVHTVDQPGGQIRGQVYVDLAVTTVTLPLILIQLAP